MLCFAPKGASKENTDPLKCIGWRLYILITDTLKKTQTEKMNFHHIRYLVLLHT